MDEGNMLGGIFGAFGGIIVVIIIIAALASTLFTVKQQEAVIIQRLGKFKRIANAGLNAKIPFIDQKAGVVSLRVQQLNLQVDTKTEDNVFLRMAVAVQYQVPNDSTSIHDAFYELAQPEAQITSYVYDSVRAKVPSMKLDDVFSKKDEIAADIEGAVRSEMRRYGYDIVRTLVTDIQPDGAVVKAMNDINAQQRNAEAAKWQGEAKRVQIVANATAEAESKKLQGEGIANERKAIIEGLADSIKGLEEQGINQQDVMTLILVNSYFDMLNNLGSKGVNTIMVPSNPGGERAVWDELRQTIVSGGLANESQKSGNPAQLNPLNVPPARGNTGSPAVSDAGTVA
jgi:regulator of protease activity HflC (stomatin/prohibitin superfamily)